MKRVATKHKNLKKDPRTGILYYRKGTIEVSLHTKDEDEALEKKKVVESMSDRFGSASFGHKVSKLYPKFLEDKIKQERGDLLKKKQIAHGTLQEIEYLFDSHLLPFFGKKSLSSINERLWSKYIHASKVSDLANHRKVFGTFLKWCKIKGYLKAMPDITEIPFHERRLRRIVTPDELSLIFKNANGSLLMFLSLALFMGLRRTEIMTLRWSSIDFDRKSLIVEKAFNKKRRMREIPINNFCLSKLIVRKEELGGGQWVFPNAKNKKKHADKSGLKTAWKTCLRKSNLEGITWHDFRATYEKYLHKKTEYTDTQKEKFADASVLVQRKIYISMDADDLRGLEDVVNLKELDQILLNKESSAGKTRGNNS